MTRIHPLLACAFAAATLLAGCGDRGADTTGAAPAATGTAPPPVDPAVQGAPGGVLAAPSSTVPTEPADPTAEHFGKLDANRNGAVTPEEHAQGAAAMFQAMDANGDGEVTAAEMDAARPAPGFDAHMASADRIEFSDSNGDGILGRNEHADGSRMMFATMDTNADGTLDRGEVRARHERAMGSSASGARPAAVTRN